MTHAVRRFHVGDRLSEMAIHDPQSFSAVAKLAGVAKAS